MTQHKQSHRIKWHDQHIKWHDMTCHVATNPSSSPHVTSQPSTLLHLTPQATSWHQNRSHHHHGTAEGSFTAKKWFGHRAGRSPCAHSIGKFFLWLIGFFLWNFRPRLVRALLVANIKCTISSVSFLNHLNLHLTTSHPPPHGSPTAAAARYISRAAQGTDPPAALWASVPCRFPSWPAATWWGHMSS